MIRGADERVADVRRLLAAACRVYEERARMATALARSTGLSAQGVELGFASLEREASTGELHALVASAGDAAHVHVILSANVFVAPLRAIAVARAASGRVTVQPSSRDPFLARALVDAAHDPAIGLAEGSSPSPEVDRIDVYGRDETIAAVRSSACAGVVVRGHGAGLGVAIVTAAESTDASARALAADVVPFEQRGCLSPRIAFVEGPLERGAKFAEVLHEALEAWESSVPRGTLTAAEQADAARWRDALAFAGPTWAGARHAVALATFAGPATLAVPPVGRHVLVLAVASLDEARVAIDSIARFVVTVGANDPQRLAASQAGARVVPLHARLARLGAMQRPPLDGPVDRRGSV
jgi:hypothetical protein